jgi:ribosome-associated protein
MTHAQFSPLVQSIIEGLEDRKAENITILNLQSIDNAICDYFIIAEGNSNTQVKALTQRVEEIVQKKLNDKPWHVEGVAAAEWVLMDYVNAVVHLFKKETRKFYDLESLWGDAETTVI